MITTVRSGQGAKMKHLSGSRHIRIIMVVASGLLLFAYLLISGGPRVAADLGIPLGEGHWRGAGRAFIQLDQKDLLKAPVSVSSGEVRTGGWTTLSSEDFEGTFPKTGWTLYGNPTWGKRGYRKYAGAFSGYAVGGGDHGVKPPGPYPNNVNSWLVAGPFDLTQATDAQVLFHAWIDTEYRSNDDHDNFCVYASIDGEEWWGDYWYGDWTGIDGCKGWCNNTFDLTDVYHLGNLCGQSKVWIAFGFVSDSHSSNNEGVYLDDIDIRAKLPAAANPLYFPWVLGR